MKPKKIGCENELRVTQLFVPVKSPSKQHHAVVRARIRPDIVVNEKKTLVADDHLVSAISLNPSSSARPVLDKTVLNPAKSRDDLNYHQFVDLTEVQDHALFDPISQRLDTLNMYKFGINSREKTVRLQDKLGVSLPVSYLIPHETTPHYFDEATRNISAYSRSILETSKKDRSKPKNIYYRSGPNVNLNLYKTTASIDLFSMESLQLSANNMKVTGHNEDIIPLYTPASFRQPVRAVTGWGSVPTTSGPADAGNEGGFRINVTARPRSRGSDVIASADGAGNDDDSVVVTAEMDDESSHFEDDASLNDPIEKSNSPYQQIGKSSSTKEIGIFEEAPKIAKSRSSSAGARRSISAAEPMSLVVNGSGSGGGCGTRAVQTTTAGPSNTDGGLPVSGGGNKIHCVSCASKIAVLWCQQCVGGFCAVCWGRIEHHSFMDMIPLPSLSRGATSQGGATTAAATATTPREFVRPHTSTMTDAAPKPRGDMAILCYRDYPLNPVYVDGKGNVHHFPTDGRQSTDPSSRNQSPNGRTYSPSLRTAGSAARTTGFSSPFSPSNDINYDRGFSPPDPASAGNRNDVTMSGVTRTGAMAVGPGSAFSAAAAAQTRAAAKQRELEADAAAAAALNTMRLPVVVSAGAAPARRIKVNNTITDEEKAQIMLKRNKLIAAASMKLNGVKKHSHVEQREPLRKKVNVMPPDWVNPPDNETTFALKNKKSMPQGLALEKVVVQMFGGVPVAVKNNLVLETLAVAKRIEEETQPVREERIKGWGHNNLGSSGQVRKVMHYL